MECCDNDLHVTLGPRYSEPNIDQKLIFLLMKDQNFVSPKRENSTSPAVKRAFRPEPKIPGYSFFLC